MTPLLQIIAICISEIFKSYYSTVFQETIPVRAASNIEICISSCVSRSPQHIYSFDDYFSSEENSYHFTNINYIRKHINNICNKKSSVFDDISNFVNKKFPDSTLKLLAIIFNNCINNGYFPSAWKIAKILPIRKTRDSIKPEDFRPISLLSNIGKLFEHKGIKGITQHNMHC